MRKKSAVSFLILLLFPFLLKAEWIPLNNSKSSPTEPQVSLISDDEKGTVLKIEISGFDLKDLITNNKHYQLADLLSESFTMKPGHPAIPYIAKVLAVPDKAGISIEILETGNFQTFNNIDLAPARENWFEGEAEPEYIENQKTYQSGKPFPGEYASLDPPAIFRDFRIVRLSVFPVQYIAVKKELRVASSITVRLNYSEDGAINPKTTPRREIAPSFDHLYRNFIFNYQSLLDNWYEGKDDAHELMLCIMPDEYVDSFQPYAEWKRLSGIDIHITRFSDIGANANDPLIIKNHITDAYLNWEVPPTYVLLVGDNGVFPVFIVSYGYSFPNEDYFVEIEGNDYFPELLVGRFTHQSDYGMQVMINKFMKYEMNPDTSYSEWFKQATVCSNNYYISQVETKRFCAELMLEEGNFSKVDTMMSDYPCSYNVTDVMDAIEEGRSYLNYRGEGWSDGWNATCYPFKTWHVSSLNNGEMFTFVTSIGCGVAMFNASGGNCFGEEWVELGTLSDPKGAAAFIGPTSNTHTTYNNKIDKGIYLGMFHEGLETPGEALLRGKLYMYSVFGNEYYVEYHFRIYCVLGDPSIHIWKDVPQAVDVVYPESIPIGNNLAEFMVTHSATGQPVKDAFVCITGKDIFFTGTTDITGSAYVAVNTTVIETLDVSVRGGNVYPFHNSLFVIEPSGAYVIEDSFLIDDLAGGNGNGVMDYGESNLLSLTMKNVGVQTAENVVVTLSTDNSFISFTDTTENYGDIGAGSTAVVVDGFAYTVADNIPDLTPVSIAVSATNGTDIWTSYLTIIAHAPVLEYLNFEIADPTGNNNGKLDPGETVDFTIHIQNSGSSDAFNVSGILTETDPYLTIANSQQVFGNISQMSQATAVYSVSAAANTPVGHLAAMTLNLSGSLGISGSGELEVIIGQIPVLIINLENGSSASEMSNALNNLNIAFETLSSFPPDLNIYSAIFVCLGIFPNNHPLSSTEGQVLADYLNAGGSLYMEGGDTWYFDPNTPVHNMFNINPIGDGYSDLSTIEGITGTPTEGMSFIYSGENEWIDRIDAISPAARIFENQSPQYGTCVAYNSGDYKTIGASHEFGGLDDGISPSTKEELMAEYLEFLGVTFSLQASFNSDITEVCEQDTVDFFDMSVGDVVSWLWNFEGGNPASSILQNPSIYYSNPGSYDVSLTVSDGVENSTLTLYDYITVFEIPDIPPVPSGPTQVCGTEGISTYSTAGSPGITTYQWTLDPAEAGNVIGTGLTANVLWTTGYLGDALVKTAGTNICGTGSYSAGLNIIRYVPEVTLAPYNMVCVDDPPFALSGGMPAGGVYSGPGVIDGWFYPATADTGIHVITYTYIDPEECENYATKTILVDPCTGIHSNPAVAGIQIFPNPGKGTFYLKSSRNCKIDVTILNSVNERIRQETGVNLSQGTTHPLDLSTYPAGIYIIHFSDDTSEFVSKIIILN